ncbi:MAG: metal ABC transporter permease [Bacilli bacterium]|nr:metal ABC transporter permease [Bacilli bacterium]
MSVISEMLSYAFLSRALIAGILISICASLLGVVLVLKNYSMIGDGLSHVGFGSLAVATALGLAPLKVTIPIVIIVAFFLLKINDSSKIKGDAAIALIASSSMAIGVLSVSLRGVNTDINNYLFGSILSISQSDVLLSVTLTLIILALYIIFYNKIFIVTFDENFAKAVGINTDLYNMLIAILTAITIVLGMRLMGSLLISSLIIFPTLTSMRLFKTFKSVIVSSMLVSVICFIIGMILSYNYSLPTGSSIVVVNMLCLILFSVINQIKLHVNK